MTNTDQPIFRPFRQVPEWSDEETFVISGRQLKTIQELFKSYTPFMQAMESVFTDNLDNGKITIKYEDKDGNPITKEEVQEMLDSYAQLMAKQMSGNIPTYEQAANDEGTN